MMKVFSLLILISSFTAYAKCQLNEEIISLSAPVTGVLQEMDLLQDKNLKGISVFHPVLKNDYKGERLGGGVFLAQKVLKGFSHKTLFYDESGEVTRRLKNASLKKIIEVKTRSLDPFEVTTNVLQILENYTRDCATEILRVKLWVASEKEELLKLKTFRHPLYFFLGRIKNQKLPELMMVNDGPVLFWKRHRKIKTFESNLAYVRWGEKWRKSLTSKDVMVGIVEAKAGEKFHLEKGEARFWNVVDVGALTPGPAQIHFMHRFAETWID
ncbi:MAG: hypothetical protein K2P81_10700 [Bacteriovoracaceae bacterium]|nr:hypothetical protein [Bacteriovoracaceae bacterium]